MRFKDFLLNENRAYLAQKVGDILAGLQELQSDAPNMGTRDLTQYAMRIVMLIRRVLHSSWPKDEKPNLAILQKAAVALMKAIEEKSDLAGAITGASSLLEKLSAELGSPVNKITGTETPPDSADSKNTAKTENVPKKPAETPPQAEPAQPPADASAPPTPEAMETAPQGTPPTGGTGQDMAAPPLGGSTGQLDAI